MSAPADPPTDVRPVDHAPGDIVDVRVSNARVTAVQPWHADGQFHGHVLVLEYGSPVRTLAVHPDDDSVSIDRIAGVGWPPLPGDKWTGKRGRWFFAVGGVDKPVTLIDESGSRWQPDDANGRHGPLRLTHRQQREPGPN